MVDSLDVPQKFEVESPRGSKRGTMGFSFPASASRSAMVSWMAVVDVLATLTLVGANAVAVAARMEAIASFMMLIECLDVDDMILIIMMSAILVDR